DAHEQLAKWLRRAPELLHDPDSESVGIPLLLARVGRVEQRAADEEHGAAAGDVTEQQADEEGRAAGLNDLAQAVAMLHVAELVRQHPGDLVRLLGLLQEAVEQIDLAARQREGVRNL